MCIWDLWNYSNTLIGKMINQQKTFYNLFYFIFIRHFEICLHAHSLTRPLSSFEIVFRLLGEAGWELLHKKSIRVRHNLYWEDWLRAYSRLSWEVAAGGPRITRVLRLGENRCTKNLHSLLIIYFLLSR